MSIVNAWTLCKSTLCQHDHTYRFIWHNCASTLWQYDMLELCLDGSTPWVYRQHKCLVDDHCLGHGHHIVTAQTGSVVIKHTIDLSATIVQSTLWQYNYNRVALARCFPNSYDEKGDWWLCHIHYSDTSSVARQHSGILVTMWSESS